MRVEGWVLSGKLRLPLDLVFSVSGNCGIAEICGRSADEHEQCIIFYILERLYRPAFSHHESDKIYRRGAVDSVSVYLNTPYNIRSSPPNQPKLRLERVLKNRSANHLINRCHRSADQASSASSSVARAVGCRNNRRPCSDVCGMPAQI